MIHIITNEPIAVTVSRPMTSKEGKMDFIRRIDGPNKLLHEGTTRKRH